jgi:hypothetical protein
MTRSIQLKALPIVAALGFLAAFPLFSADRESATVVAPAYRATIQPSPAGFVSPAESVSWKRRMWKASVAALAGASAVDAASSWGGHELNPLLRGTNGNFGGRAVAIKAGLAGGILVGQYFALRHTARGGETGGPGGNTYATFGVVNFAAAAVLGGVAARNYGIR